MPTTGRKPPAVASLKSEQLACSALDALVSHLCVLDETGTIIAVNKAWRDYTAKNSTSPMRTAEGVNYLTVCDAVTGEFAEQAATFATGIRAVLNGERRSFTYEYFCPSATYSGWFLGRVTRFVRDGLVRALVVHEDITDRKIAEGTLRESEALFRTLAETSQAGIAIIQGEKFVYCNPAIEHRSGYAREELLAMPFWMGIAPEFREPLQTYNLAIQRGEKTSVNHELKIVTKNGEERWIQAFIGALHFRGRPAVLAVMMDVTARKQAEEALQTFSRRILDAQEQERRHLARELHDELGQVLSALKITLQNGQQQPDAMAERVEESVAMVEQAIEQVRTLSRNLRPPMLDDLGLVASVRWYVNQQTQLTGAHVRFVVDVPDQRFPPEVETACFRVIQESLTNIMRHAQAQQMWVELCYRDGALHVLVRDDGLGFNVKVAYAGVANGTSSGLLGMQERAQLVGGHVQVTSVGGSGTEVHAVFPLVLDSAQAVQKN